MQIFRGKTISKNKKILWTIFLKFIMFDIMPYFHFLESATRLQQKDFPLIVATTKGKQRPRHCLFFRIKKQKNVPFHVTHSSVAKKVTQNTQNIFLQGKNISICDKLPYSCVHS